MRIRTIKPEFWTHPVMSRMPDAARLVAIGLLNCADDEGYFYADARIVRCALRQYDENSTTTQEAIDQLIKIGYIEIREHDTHGRLGRIISFAKHQIINRPNKSTISPLFSECNAGPRQPTKPARGTDSAENYSPKTPNEGQDAEPAAAPPKPERKPRKRNPLFDALAIATDGQPEKLTKSASRAVGVALADIRQASPDVTPEEIARRAANYRLHMPNVTLTANALAKHWARCEHAPSNARGGIAPQSPAASEKREYFKNSKGRECYIDWSGIDRDQGPVVFVRHQSDEGDEWLEYRRDYTTNEFIICYTQHGERQTAVADLDPEVRRQIIRIEREIYKIDREGTNDAGK